MSDVLELGFADLVRNTTRGSLDCRMYMELSDGNKKKTKAM